MALLKNQTKTRDYFLLSEIFAMISANASSVHINDKHYDSLLNQGGNRWFDSYDINVDAELYFLFTATPCGYHQGHTLSNIHRRLQDFYWIYCLFFDKFYVFIREKCANWRKDKSTNFLLVETHFYRKWIVISWMFNFQTLKFISKFNWNLIPKIKPEHLNQIS